MKVKMNPWLEQAHGKSGDLVFKKYGNEVIIARRAQPHEPNTPAQQAVKQNFKLAAVYGKTVMANPTELATYKARAKELGKPVFSVIVADFLTAPVVDEIDLSQYGGQTGDVIAIRAHDDVQVTGVQVQVRDTNGTVLEQGSATQSATDGVWQYTATTNLTTGQQVAIDVSATDLPGHTGMLEKTATQANKSVSTLNAKRKASSRKR